MNVEFTLAGLIVGIFVGLTGMGGGSLVAPVLVLLGVPVVPAVGSALVFAAVTQTIGGVQHARQGGVEYRTVAWLALGSVPAGVLSSWLFVDRFRNAGLDTRHLTQILGVVLMLVAVALLVRPFLSRERVEGAARAVPGWLLTSGGAAVGVMAGVSSVGSGSLTTAFLSLTAKGKGRRVVGTVLVHAALLTVSAGVTHWALGDVNLAWVAALLLGSVPGVLVASRLTALISETHIRTGLAFGLLALGFLMLRPEAKELASRLPASAAAAAVGGEVAPAAGAVTP
jgi:uncharacterized membrane protein YfcA